MIARSGVSREAEVETQIAGSCGSARWKGWALNVPCSLSISLNDFPGGAKAKSGSVRSDAFSLCFSVRWGGWVVSVPRPLSLNDFPGGSGG